MKRKIVIYMISGMLIAMALIVVVIGGNDSNKEENIIEDNVAAVVASDEVVIEVSEKPVEPVAVEVVEKNENIEKEKEKTEKVIPEKELVTRENEDKKNREQENVATDSAKEVDVAILVVPEKEIAEVSKPDASKEASEEVQEVAQEEVKEKVQEVEEEVKEVPEASEDIPKDVKGYAINAEAVFGASEISASLMEKMNGKSWHENDAIHFEDLRLITVTYFGYDDQDHIGEIIVHKAVESDVISIFKGAYEQSYPFEKIVPIYNYDGSDKQSMADNNTSAFNYRTVSGKDYLSMHAYGIAIDISPVANPYVSKKGIYPKTGTQYADRSTYQKGMIINGDVLYNLFIDHGWKWGGDWNKVQDYQHFEKRAVLDQVK